VTVVKANITVNEFQLNGCIRKWFFYIKDWKKWPET
jgi:hypothetical protein